MSLVALYWVAFSEVKGGRLIYFTHSGMDYYAFNSLTATLVHRGVKYTWGEVPQREEVRNDGNGTH